MKAPTTLMWNKAKTLLVPVGDPEGRFFAYAQGWDIPDDAPLKVVEKVKDRVVVEPPSRRAATERKE